ncbi:MAG: FAD-dependent tricarballylate dehydrogenase TcuA [Pseudomonadota bacterium]|nr:FAD-dependent tricarballylate dehydrogenase TcuA [Pseudomonadota bacterium]
MRCDVLVLGGGNAALCAALTARESGASVLLLECAPIEFRGGNSRHTRNLRCMHDTPEGVLIESYGEHEYWDDLWRVTGGLTDESLARLTISESARVRPWMHRHGARFQPALGGTLHLGRTNAFFLGGGKALLNAYYRSARMLGVEVRYDSEVVALEIAHGRFIAAIVRQGERTERIEASALVAAAGGFESNLEWLRDAWGPAADNFIVRGTPYNRGAVLRALLDSGAEQVGDPTQCHAVAIDARAPKFDGGIVTRVDCVSLGIVVNRASQRFYDEGEDFWPKRYAIWGRLVAQQPDQIAYSIIDSKAIGRFMPPVFPGERAATIPELADKLSLDRPALQATIDQFNASVQPGTFDHAVLDDCATAGITPPKTHWAQCIEKPPYFGFPLRPGITFTYLGVRVDADARIVMSDGARSANMVAAGEIMAGNVLGQGYVAGIGMTIGTVFGRIAGASSARLAQSMQ